MIALYFLHAENIQGLHVHVNMVHEVVRFPSEITDRLLACTCTSKVILFDCVVNIALVYT